MQISRRGLRDDDNFKFGPAIRQAKLGKAARQRKRDGLNASNTWREKMTVQQKLHDQDLGKIAAGEERRKCIRPFAQAEFSRPQRTVMFVCQYSDIARGFAVLSWPEMRGKVQASLSQPGARHDRTGTVR
jgi:phage-related protein